ncbi:MAG: hypothetical protein HC794_02265 [Nitrospiraceae bacterium]|nr:hypothetical protein [Nitrospiraceae bacterium]
MLAWSRPIHSTRDLIHLINARRHDHGDTDDAIDTLQAFLEQGREHDLLTVLAALDEEMAEWLFDLVAEASCTLLLDGPNDEKPAYATDRGVRVTPAGEPDLSAQAQDRSHRDRRSPAAESAAFCRDGRSCRVATLD